MNAKLSQHRFWHFHENRLIKMIKTIPHNLYVSLKLTTLLLWIKAFSWIFLILSKGKLTWHSPTGCGLSFELSWWASFHSSVKTYADWVWHSLQIGELCCIFIGLHRRQRRPPFGLRHLPGVLPHPVFPPLLVRVDGLGRGGAVPSQLRLCFPSFKADEKWPTFQDQQLNNNNRIHSDGNNKKCEFVFYARNEMLISI